jgi:poly-beta-1,6-N-acetyl-D-glucosamine synthase
MSILLFVFYAITVVIITIGTLMLVYYPLAIIAELRLRRPPVFDNPFPLVSIIVPAYNEEKVVGNCVKSIESSSYRNFEIILVDDGSTDHTLQVMRRYEDPPRVRVIAQPNAGKASALNAGFQQAKGEILFFVDADGIFTYSTIREMLNAFTSRKIGAVCGNDHPLNQDTLLTKLYCLQTHVGTGFVRRALAEINCLPIVSGNCGAFRRVVLSWPFTRLGNKEEPYVKGFIGEDLELTWRIHRAGYRVGFAPRAIVRAEVPSTLIFLWKQRVRWARGLLQTIKLHRDMFFNLKYGTFGLYLPINFFNMVVNPILQLLVVFLLIIIAISGFSPIQLSVFNFILWTGLGGALFTVIFSVALNGAWKDLQYFYAIPLWLPYSLLMDVVDIWAIILELRGTEAKWNKIERTGIRTGRTGVRNRENREKKE